MLKTIIMDFDGLIVDTEMLWYQIYVNWFRDKKNYELSVEEFLLCVGSNSEDLFRALDKAGLYVDRELFVKDTQERFIQESSLLPAKDGVEDFLRSAKEHGLYVALATSAKKKKPTVHLERLGLMKYFDRLVTAEEVEHIKPEPDLFYKAAEYADCQPEECLVVEDSQNGLLAGVRAGMRVLVVPNGVTQYCDFTGEYLKMNSLAEADLNLIMKDF